MRSNTKRDSRQPHNQAVHIKYGEQFESGLVGGSTSRPGLEHTSIDPEESDSTLLIDRDLLRERNETS